LEPKIEIFPGKKFVGKRIKMSFTENKTRELWQSLMPRKKEIKNNIGGALYSIEIYEPFYFTNFNPEKEFEKWAAIEVRDFDAVPDEMETLISPAGLYAVFLHKGPASEGLKTYRYVFENWFPNQEYLLDDRPHFAIMGEKYKSEDPDSEEEILIPVKLKK